MTVSNDIAGHQTTAAQAGLEFGRQSGGHGAVEGRQGVEEVVYERVRDRLSEADRLLRRIDSSWSPPPFDPILVAQVLGIRCVPVKNPSLHQAMIMMSDGTPTILYRQQRCPARTRYILPRDRPHPVSGLSLQPRLPAPRASADTGTRRSTRVRPGGFRIHDADGSSPRTCSTTASEPDEWSPCASALACGRRPPACAWWSQIWNAASCWHWSLVASRGATRGGGVAARAMSLTPGGVDLRYTTPPPPHPSDRRD